MSRSASFAADLHSSAQLAPAGGRGLPARTASISSLISSGMYFLGYLRSGSPVLPSSKNFSKLPLENVDYLVGKVRDRQERQR